MTHQVLHECICDIELGGANLAHVGRVAQVVDGEVYCEYLLTDFPSCVGTKR